MAITAQLQKEMIDKNILTLHLQTHLIKIDSCKPHTVDLRETVYLESNNKRREITSNSYIVKDLRVVSIETNEK